MFRGIKGLLMIFLLVFATALLASGLTLYLYNLSNNSNDCVTKDYITPKELRALAQNGSNQAKIGEIEEEIKEIYKYNLTDDDRELTYEELITRGGDCKNWAEHWIERLREEGYNAEYERVYLYTKEEDKSKVDYYHGYAKIGMRDQWCIASSNWIECWRFE